jgi:hypothetical protein
MRGCNIIVISAVLFFLLGENSYAKTTTKLKLSVLGVPTVSSFYLNSYTNRERFSNNHDLNKLITYPGKNYQGLDLGTLTTTNTSMNFFLAAKATGLRFTVKLGRKR